MYKKHQIQNDRIEEKLDMILQYHNIKWHSAEEKKNIKSLATQVMIDGDVEAAKKLEVFKTQ
ncbi:hypothetical protein LNTAR_07174 [Lentisphaera araneosa HTCC2155]|uniref:Uncharacterized protein n=1 Tax=Lentisphaera araneosa HTCC2155 TaxID=313628 RepID=A6DMX0_9BACT|nr:hypothetical protein [Lentisphaera araneosa]EDM27006.1 hypothetical protein LNTAR_07174 [Lentisphaera araneosa HTCC2155]